jgi:hypothetical protein
MGVGYLSELGVVVMSKPTIDYYPTHAAVTGLVTDNSTGFDWYETVKMSGYYCDEENCPDEGECPDHPKGYWRNVMRQAWLESVTSRGMRPIK